MTLFHKSPALYEPGFEITPGNFGRVVLGRGATHSLFLRESLFEEVRQNEFYDLPSRLASCFAFDDHNVADNFDPVNFPNLYRVRWKEEPARVHRVPMEFLEIRACRSLETIRQVARRYWQADPDLPGINYELLAETPLIVEERLSHFLDDMPS